MRILIINQHPEDHFGGSEFQCDVIASKLAERKHEVIYFAVNSHKKNYTTDKYKIISGKKISFISIYRLFKFQRPEVVYWRYDKHNLLLTTLIAKMFSIPIIFSVSHIENLKVFKFKTLSKSSNINTFIRSQLSNIKQIVASINYFGIYLCSGIIVNNADFYKLIPSRIKNKIVIRNSVPLCFSEKKLLPRRPYVLWVANIKREKHPEEFLKLASKLSDYNIDFLMVGGIQGVEYNFLFDKKKIPPNLNYLGKLNICEVNSLIMQSLILVHTCDPEGFSNILIQSWLLSRPTVSLNFDPEGAIESYKLGYHSKNPERLVADVKKLLDSKYLREDLGRNAKKYAETMFDPANNVSSLEVFLSKIKKT